MKTAISIEDGILREADETARQMGLSRSRLFALAVTEFLQRYRSEQVRIRLSNIYANEAEPNDRRLLKGIKAKVCRTIQEHW
ncbi:MAG: hypothetical protein WBE37_08695 [Bryobacteraceae bacterium]